MTFVHAGLALAGILCVAIPIMIHLLLRQRRRPIVWAAMRFLMEAYRRQRRKLRLQQLLLLAMRCLLVLLLALAIGRPLLERAGLLGGSGRTVYFLIDNGLAASTADAEGAALDRHRATALAMLGELGADDQAGLVALGGPVDPLVVPASSDHCAVASLIEGIEAVDSATDLGTGIEALATEIPHAFDRSGEVVVVILSDFYLGSADASRPLSTALAELEGVTVIASPPRAASPGNVQIIDVEPLRSVVLTGSGGIATDQNVRVTLRRSGPLLADSGVSQVTVRVNDGEPHPDDVQRQQTVRWQPGQSEATVWIQLDTAARDDAAGAGQVLSARIDHDAVMADNVRRRAIAVRESLVVGIVDQRRFGVGPGAASKSAADWIRLALQPTTGTPIDIREVEPSQVDVPALVGLDAVFLPSPHLLNEEAWRRLRQFCDRGGMLIVTPPAGVAVHLWPDAMERTLDLGWRIAREAASTEVGAHLDDEAFGPLLTLIDSELPTLVRSVVVERHLPIEETTSATQSVLTLRDGGPWLIAAPPGRTGDDGSDGERGLVIFLASAPELTWTTLPAMPLMVPLMQEIVRQGVGEATGAWSTTAGHIIATAPSTARLERLGGEEQVIVDGDRAYAGRAIRRAGVWRAVDAAGRDRGLIAVNADAEAGRLDLQAESIIRAWLAEAFGTDAVASEARPSGIAWLDPAAPGLLLSRSDQGSPVSLPLFIGALALALAEMLLARLFSHATIDDPAGRRGAPALAGGGP